jgi:hypothetical protein
MKIDHEQRAGRGRPQRRTQDLECRLPLPRLTATIMPPGPAPHSRGQVTVHGYTPAPREDRPVRANGGYHCTRCASVGIDGRGHSSRNARCPSRLTPVPIRKPSPRAATTRSRCAARYAYLVNCSLREAAKAFAITATAARDGWAEIYAGIPIDPAQRYAR